MSRHKKTIVSISSLLFINSFVHSCFINGIIFNVLFFLYTYTIYVQHIPCYTIYVQHIPYMYNIYGACV